ncbi:MAG: hypothetical protein WC966_12030 [Bradymonadales bacterium]
MNSNNSNFILETLFVPGGLWTIDCDRDSRGKWRAVTIEPFRDNLGRSAIWATFNKNGVWRTQFGVIEPGQTATSATFWMAVEHNPAQMRRVNQNVIVNAHCWAQDKNLETFLRNYLREATAKEGNVRLESMVTLAS